MFGFKFTSVLLIFYLQFFTILNGYIVRKPRQINGSVENVTDLPQKVTDLERQISEEQIKVEKPKEGQESTIDTDATAEPVGQVTTTELRLEDLNVVEKPVEEKISTELPSQDGQETNNPIDDQALSEIPIEDLDASLKPFEEAISTELPLEDFNETEKSDEEEKVPLNDDNETKDQLSSEIPIEDLEATKKIRVDELPLVKNITKELSEVPTEEKNNNDTMQKTTPKVIEPLKHDEHNEKDCPKKGLWFNKKEEKVEETTTEMIVSTQFNSDYESLESEETIDRIVHHYQNTCVYEEMKPLKFTCIGEPICAYLACSFLLLMMIFNLVKNIHFYGCRKLFDLRLHGTSFPQRPELIVIICSTLPLIFVSLCRPIFLTLNYHHEMFIFHAGFPQLRAFFDYFSRSATLYHMIFWAYRMPIINLIWKIFMFTRLKIIAFKERKNDEMQFSSKKFRRGRRRRKKRRPGQQRQPKSKPATKVVGISGVSKPNTRPTGRKRHRKAKRNQKQARTNQPLTPMDIYNFGGQNFWNNMGSPGMMMEGGPMGMNMGNFGASGMMMGGDASLFMNEFFDMDHGEGNADEEKALEDEIIIPEITREFVILCKRIIPGVIYGFSFIVNLPVLADFEQYYSDPNSYIKSKPKMHIRRFLIYDIVFLMAIPMIAILIAFFYGIIKDVQLNGETKMKYSLKCYYITFIVLNMPIFILYLVYLNMDIVPGYKFGTCLILALTVYHANFILKSTVHGTACNLICCTENYFKSHTKLKKWLDDMTTPILVKQRRANEKMVDFKR